MPIMNEKNAIVKFCRENGPITIEVTSGYCTRGSFILGYMKRGEYIFREFGKDPKRVDDDILDIYQIPIDLTELSSHRVSIIGKYAPSPGYQQIKLKYAFIQKNSELLVTPVKANLIEVSTAEPFLRFTHNFDFAE